MLKLRRKFDEFLTRICQHISILIRNSQSVDSWFSVIGSSNGLVANQR